MAGRGGKGGTPGGQGNILNVQLSRDIAQRLATALNQALGNPGGTVAIPLVRADWQQILIAVSSASPFLNPKGKGKGKGKGIS